MLLVAVLLIDALNILQKVLLFGFQNSNIQSYLKVFLICHKVTTKIKWQSTKLLFRKANVIVICRYSHMFNNDFHR